MKKRVTFCMIALTAALLAGCSRGVDKMAYIGADSAKQAALNAAGLTSGQVTFSGMDMGTQNGMDYYHVAFTANGQTYQYDIEALTGKVIDSNTPANGGNAASGSLASSQTTAAANPAGSQTTAAENPADETAGSNGSNETTQETLVPAGGETVPEKSAANPPSDKESYNVAEQTTEAPETDPFLVRSGSVTVEVPNVPAATNASGASNQPSAMISDDDAKAKALAHAGLSADQATFVECRLDWEDGRQVYEIEFYGTDLMEYDYEIDPYTGDVIRYDLDAERYTAPAPSPAQNETAAQADPSGMISADDAKARALAHAELLTGQVIQASFVKCALEWDDGRQVYEVEFYGNDYTEYDYEIDPYTGDVIQYDLDAEYFAAPSTAPAQAPAAANPSSGNISENDAKASALSHAGLTEDQVTFTKCKLDRDDGKQVYEIEFYDGSFTEYEYEIDAASGTVLSYDREAKQRSSSGSASLTAEEAKQLALSQVPGAAAGDICDFETDYDDGHILYEGTIHYDGMDFEFEIDGHSGAICDWSGEHCDESHHSGAYHH